MAQQTSTSDQRERGIRNCLMWATIVSAISLVPIPRLIVIGDSDFALPDRWVPIVLLNVLLASAISSLMLLLPHRTNARWVAIWLTIMAGAHAAVMGLFTFGGAENELLSGLDLSDEFLHGNGLIWTGVMTLLCVAGSLGSHWSASQLEN